jgi:CHAD domain-containing protein
VRRRDPAALAVRSAMAGAVARFEGNDALARQGDVEGIHRLRTTTRRLRSELRTFADLIEPAWRARLEGELKWLADLLGGVRDLDVLTDRLVQSATAIDEKPGRSPDSKPKVVPALAPLFDDLRQRHERESRALQKALLGPRFERLRTDLVEAVAAPELRVEAAGPCREVLPPLAKAAWKRLAKKGRILGTSDPEEDFHEVRKRAKRARYTAERIAPTLGRRAKKPAARFVRRMTQLQDVLGEHQDAVVACQEIERSRDRHKHNSTFALAADLLLSRERAAADAARAQFFRCWKKMDRKSLRSWMKSRTKS